MKHPGNRYSPLIMLLIILMCGACQTGKKSSPVLIQDLDESELLSGIESFHQIYHLYPSPGEMLSVIDMENTSFDKKLLNPVSKLDQYLDSKAKSLVLGVYMSDLAYAALFGRHEEALDYLETVKTLSEDLSLHEAVDESMIIKARENVQYLDSLYVISNDAFMNILTYCEINERSNLVVLLSAGAFIESLFLAVNMIDDYATAGHLLQHLADQKYSIDNFMMFALSLNSDDPGVQSTIRDLEKIQTIYSGITPITGEVSIKTSATSDETQGKKLVIGGSDKASEPVLSEKDFDALKAEVIELRTRIVQAN